MKIALCGSLSMGQDFLDIKEELEKRGHDVLIPDSLRKFNLRTELDAAAFKSESGSYMKIKPVYMKEHFKKIEESDAILVVNKNKKGIENYIGGNTFAEIMVAFFLEKKIFILNPIPDHERLKVFKEEIEGVNPVVLNGLIENIE